jgi:hypothetical protein
MYENVTILLQGILHKDINLAETLNVYTKLCNVVLSVYKTDLDETLKICESFPGVIIVENDITEYDDIPLILDKKFSHCMLNNIYNGFFQICTTKKGLSVIHTEYVIKSRIDHYYSRMSKFIHHGLNTNKIISSSVFVRGCNDKQHPCRFCLSDCLFMGKTSDIKLCFNLCYENRLLTRPETGIWEPYFIHIFKLKGIDINSVNNDEYIKYMLELVDVYCITKLQPYKIKFRTGIETRMNDKLKTTQEYLTYGCDC